jgi:hypothetical protein
LPESVAARLETQIVVLQFRYRSATADFKPGAATCSHPDQQHATTKSIGLARDLPEQCVMMAE